MCVYSKTSMNENGRQHVDRVLCAVPAFATQIARGSELVLQCTSNVTVLHIKKDLSLRTGIPAVDIELCIGREPLENGFRLINHGGTPFFLFNRNEPSNQPDAPSGHGTRQIIRDEDIDWSLYSKCVLHTGQCIVGCTGGRVRVTLISRISRTIHCSQNIRIRE